MKNIYKSKKDIQIEELENWKKQQLIPRKTDYTDFNEACKQFRDLCKQIGILINKENFKGGYDELSEFYASPAYTTTEGLKLAIACKVAEDWCKHEAGKLGIYKPGDPTWWYTCWNEENNI